MIDNRTIQRLKSDNARLEHQIELAKIALKALESPGNDRFKARARTILASLEEARRQEEHGRDNSR